MAYFFKLCYIERKGIKMSESPDSGGESPSNYSNPSKYAPKHTPVRPPSYSSGESPDDSGESPTDNWARPIKSPTPIPIPIPIHITINLPPAPVETEDNLKPVKKNKRYRI